MFPVIAVDKKSDKYFTYTKNDWFRDEAQRRAGGTESAGGGYGLSTGSYSADVFAFHKDVDDQTLANADAPINPLREATEFVTRRLMLRKEIQWNTDFFTSSIWGNDYAGVAGTPGANQVKQWSDYAASDPIDDIEDAKAGILSTTGMEPNTLVLGYDVFRALKNHPDIVDRIKYTSAQTVTSDMLASMFDIPRVIISKGVKATNNEGATAAYSFTSGKKALLAYVAPTPGLLTPSAGYSFSWTGVSGGIGSTVGVSSFRMESLKADRIEGEMAFDNKVIASDLGWFWDSVVA